jgi:hypothetical protein
LQDYINAEGDVVGHERRHPDTEIDVEAVSQLLCDALYDAFALFDVFPHGRWSLVVRLWALAS